MKVFTYYDTSETAPADQSLLVTLWERSWRNRGWTPRLISERHAKRSKFFPELEYAQHLHPRLALHAMGGGLLVPMYVINFGFRPKDFETPGSDAFLYPFGIVHANKAGLKKSFVGDRVQRLRVFPCALFQSSKWAESPLVFFPDPKDILTCGRVL